MHAQKCKGLESYTLVLGQNLEGNHTIRQQRSSAEEFCRQICYVSSSVFFRQSYWYTFAGDRISKTTEFSGSACGLLANIMAIGISAKQLILLKCVPGFGMLQCIK